LQVDAQAPPAFLLHTQDDFVKVENSLAYYQACLRQGVPAELHLYPRGGHGYGLRHPGGTGSWFGLLLTWLDGVSKG
jgi:dipeptidyl aminopeptidase/acylaminoacyl peptidase